MLGLRCPNTAGRSIHRADKQRPRPHCDDDGIRLDDAAIDLDTPDIRSIGTPNEACDLPATQLGALLLRGAHHGGSEFAGVNDPCGFGGAEPGRDDDAVGQPIELGAHVTTRVMLGNGETAIGGHAAVAPIARDLACQCGVKRKTSPRQRVERGAGAPVERQEATGLAGCRRGHLGPFHDCHVDAAAREEIGGAGADHAAAADHDAHGFSAWP